MLDAVTVTIVCSSQSAQLRRNLQLIFAWLNRVDGNSNNLKRLFLTFIDKSTLSLSSASQDKSTLLSVYIVILCSQCVSLSSVRMLQLFIVVKRSNCKDL